MILAKFVTKNAKHAMVKTKTIVFPASHLINTQEFQTHVTRILVRQILTILLLKRMSHHVLFAI